MTPADEDTLRELAGAVVGRVGAGLDLEEVVVVAAGRRSIVRVVVDGDQGITLDVAAEISRNLAAELDAAEAAGTAFLGAEPYTLEVTSPGVGRPLTEERHFRRARGRVITVTLFDGGRTEGRVRRVVERNLELLTGTDAAVTSIPLDEIRRAKVEVEFGQMPPAHVALLDADGFVDPARAFDEVPAEEFTDEELADSELAESQLAESELAEAGLTDDDDDDLDLEDDDEGDDEIGDDDDLDDDDDDDDDVDVDVDSDAPDDPDRATSTSTSTTEEGQL